MIRARLICFGDGAFITEPRLESPAKVKTSHYFENHIDRCYNVLSILDAAAPLSSAGCQDSSVCVKFPSALPSHAT